MVDPRYISALTDVVSNDGVPDDVRVAAQTKLVELVNAIDVGVKPQKQCRCGNFNSHFGSGVRDA